MRVAFVVGLALVLAACGGGASPDGAPDPARATIPGSTTPGSTTPGSTTPGGPATNSATVADPAERIVAIEEARSAAEPVVAELTAASGTLAALFEAWQAAPDAVDLPTEVTDQQGRVDAAVASARAALDPAASADVAAAHDAMRAAADVVAAQLDEATGVAVDATLVARVDELGRQFVVQVNEPGSRSVQRNAMDDLIAEFDGVLADLEARVGGSACQGLLHPRIAAVAHMSDVAADLAAMATSGQGAAFDTLRAEATGDPFGQATTDLDDIAAAVDCEAVDRVTGAGPALQATITDLQRALNPPDLVES